MQAWVSALRPLSIRALVNRYCRQLQTDDCHQQRNVCELKVGGEYARVIPACAMPRLTAALLTRGGRVMRVIAAILLAPLYGHKDISSRRMAPLSEERNRRDQDDAHVGLIGPYLGARRLPR